MQSPCKDCDNKGCGVYHDECKAYQEYKEYKEEMKNAHKKEQLFNHKSYINEDTWRRRANNVFKTYKGKGRK